MVPITDCIENIYKKSKIYLRSYAFLLLSNKAQISNEWYSAIRIIQEASEGIRLQKISELFSTFSELRKDEQEIKIDNQNLFENIFQLIEQSSLQSFSIKGDPGVGKSTLMTLLYLYMLWKFSNGTSRYIPFYFSVDSIIQEIFYSQESPTDSEAYIEHAFETFHLFFSDCVEIGQKCNLPICLFIDGLEKDKLLIPVDSTIENKIYELVESELNKNNDRYIMCFNSHDSYNFDVSFDKINRFEYVMFLNKIRVVTYKINEYNQELFFSNYLYLLDRNYDSSNVVFLKRILEKFHTHSVDLFFLYHFDKHIFSINKDSSIWTVLRRHLKELDYLADDVFQLRINVARDTAGILFSQHKCYSDIISMIENGKNRPRINEYLFIINNPVIANYLIAKFYVHMLSSFSTSSNPIPDNSILFSFIPNDISILIRLILDEKEKAANEILARFINNHKSELNGYLYSMIAYLCGHLRTNGNAYLIEQLPIPDRSSNELWALCSRRSYDLAKSVCSSDSYSAKTVILELIDNEEYRNFNRSYQLHYYKDTFDNIISTQYEWIFNSYPSDGFDFRCCFLMLLSKLKPALKTNKSYPLMELDLFTLCDLIYSRLQYRSNKPFFYMKKYNEENDSECEAVLNQIITLLNDYDKHYGRHRNTNQQINAYFSFMRSRFNEIHKQIESNTGKDVNASYVSHSYDFEQIRKLSLLPRVGWSIKESGTVDNAFQPKWSTTTTTPLIKESIMEHIMESVYIAQLFLPDVLENKDYDKTKVISYIILSEIGKTYSGDYSKYYSDLHKYEKKEREGLAYILTLGAIDGYASQSRFFKSLFEHDSSDINMTICCEILMIQTEYKYYTMFTELDFDDKRRAAFENDFEEPTTSICKKIRDNLILNNPVFKEYLN